MHQRSFLAKELVHMISYRETGIQSVKTLCRHLLWCGGGPHRSEKMAQMMSLKLNF